MEYWPLIAFVGFGCFVAYMAFSKRGRGKMLGGRIVWSGRSVEFEKKSNFTGFKTAIQVHALETKQLGERKVGIELRSRSYLHFHTYPVSLTVEQANQLVSDIQQAIDSVHT